jgi:hypothetical protein
MNTPVNFEIAKLLKEKGFDLKVRSMYCEGKLLKDTNSKGNYNDVMWVRTWRNSPIDDTISAPTIAEVVMWLYEKHGVWVSLTHQHNKFFWSFGSYQTQEYNSPTEAYEAAIEYTLKNLI